MKNLPTPPLSNLVTVQVNQAGGKYGKLTCPVCGNANAMFKFSGGAGGCDACGATFVLTVGFDLTVGDQGEFGPHWMQLEVQRPENEQ